jgi:DivIVA domain-containing protein
VSTETTRGPASHKLPRHLSPEQVRSTTFERAPFGRRGFDEPAVQDFVAGLADELATRDDTIAQLARENRQLKHALREWHRQLVGYDAAELMARTQQQIEAQISQAETFSREREEEASQLYDQFAAEARERAQDEVARLLEENGDPNHLGDQQWLERQQTYVEALQQALDALAAQVDATRQAFAFELGRLP